MAGYSEDSINFIFLCIFSSCSIVSSFGDISWTMKGSALVAALGYVIYKAFFNKRYNSDKNNYITFNDSGENNKARSDIESITQEKLLNRILPCSLVKKVLKSQHVQAEFYKSATVFFSDVVGFTEIACTSSPAEVIEFLKDMYQFFDTIIAKHDVYRVEIIGDSFMVVSGLPERNGDRHAAEIANMAIELCNKSKTFYIKHKVNRCLVIRVGIHTGSCSAGVVSLTIPKYCVFGEAVTIASKMESTGEAMRIHISKTTHDLLKPINKYTMTDAGMVSLKEIRYRQLIWSHSCKIIPGYEDFSNPTFQNLFVYQGVYNWYFMAKCELLDFGIFENV